MHERMHQATRTAGGARAGDPRPPAHGSLRQCPRKSAKRYATRLMKRPSRSSENHSRAAAWENARPRHRPAETPVRPARGMDMTIEYVAAADPLPHEVRERLQRGSAPALSVFSGVPKLH